MESCSSIFCHLKCIGRFLWNLFYGYKCINLFFSWQSVSAYSVLICVGRGPTFIWNKQTQKTVQFFHSLKLFVVKNPKIFQQTLIARFASSDSLILILVYIIRLNRWLPWKNIYFKQETRHTEKDKQMANESHKATVRAQHSGNLCLFTVCSGWFSYLPYLFSLRWGNTLVLCVRFFFSG